MACVPQEDGVYRTLKKRVREKLGKDYSGLTAESKLFTDMLLAATLLTAGPRGHQLLLWPGHPLRAASHAHRHRLTQLLPPE
ncbi:hypothetical protein PR048_033757 [Dryococelus australis]|uniref:Uncharacterized protein n=1 Tax=Dryococelus australis TaxID=614101 RepID=A0ABQ9G267_9NEOP|nr:hypothetical protein PR048_033757 [Dryococelus australis]